MWGKRSAVLKEYYCIERRVDFVGCSGAKNSRKSVVHRNVGDAAASNQDAV